MILAVTFFLHICLVISLEVTAPQLQWTDAGVIRHLLPVLPILCLGAAVGLEALMRRLGSSGMATAMLVVAIFGYQAYNAAAVTQIFEQDVRYGAAEWLADNLGEDDEATTFMSYSRVRGVQLIDEPTPNSEFFVTSDLEFARYFRGENADDIFHAIGGQKRLNFFHDLFANRAGYKRVKEFRRPAFSIEQGLIEKGFLVPLDSFTPWHFLIFARSPRGDSR